MSVTTPAKPITPDTNYWRPLRHFNLYRITLALILLVMFQQGFLQGFNSQLDHQLFLVANIAFLITGLF